MKASPKIYWSKAQSIQWTICTTTHSWAFQLQKRIRYGKTRCMVSSIFLLHRAYLATANTTSGYSLRVPTAAFEALNRTSIPLNDGSGDSWAVLSVSHHLHCLVRSSLQVASIDDSFDLEIRIRSAIKLLTWDVNLHQKKSQRITSQHILVYPFSPQSVSYFSPF